MQLIQHHTLIKALSVFALFISLGQAHADFVLKAECEVGVDGVYLSDVVEAAKGAPIPAIQPMFRLGGVLSESIPLMN